MEGSTRYHKPYIFDNCTGKLCLMNGDTWGEEKVMLGIVVKGFILIKECMITQALIFFPTQTLAYFWQKYDLFTFALFSLQQSVTNP